MKVLIIGGAGYIGSHINRFLGAKGFDTIVLDNLSAGHKEAVLSGELVIGDFGDKGLLDEIFENNDIDAVMHFGALASVGDSVKSPAIYYEQNVTKFATVLNTMLEHGVNRVVFSSTAATFGEPKKIPIDENHPQNPINPYGITKLVGEKMLSDYERAYGLKSCIFRYFNAAGASKDSKLGESHTPEQHLIPLVLKTILGEREQLYVFGDDYDTRDGTCLRDFIHVEDLAEVHYKGLKYIMDNDKSESFNIGSNVGQTVMEIIKEAEIVTGQKVDYVVRGRRDGDPAKLVASNFHAKEILNWEPEHSSIKEIITDAWNWENSKTF